MEAENKTVELVTILPGFIVGPNLSTSNFSSGNAIKKFMLKEIPGLVNTKLGSVDVRDCAMAHVNAIKVPEAANKRFILVNKGVWMPELAGWLHEAHGKYYDIPQTMMPRPLIAFLACLSDDMKYLYSQIDMDTQYENKDTISILGI